MKCDSRGAKSHNLKMQNETTHVEMDQCLSLLILYSMQFICYSTNLLNPFTVTISTYVNMR